MMISCEQLDGRRVLVVEDNPVIAFDIADSLEEVRATVVVSACVSDALAAIEVAAFDGAILDVNLPDGIVMPVAERLSNQDVPVIFCTGVELPAAIKQRFPDAVVYMKPVLMNEIIRRLVALMGR
jgi:DNA-binding response OmpR family regulator